MVSVFILFAFITIACLTTGFLFYLVITNGSGKDNFRPFIVYLITGLIVISALCQLLVLIFPLNSYLQVSLCIVLAAAAASARKKYSSYLSYLKTKIKNTDILLILFTVSTWIMIGVISGGPTIMDDTESYHIQAIKWAQEYGTVPGLVNLHERFGFNSAWLTLVSVFIPVHSSHNYFSVLNGLLSVWLSGYLFCPLWDRCNEDNSHSDLPGKIGLSLVICCSIVSWPLIRGNAANANYDFVTTMLVLVLFLELWKNRKSTALTDMLAPELLLWPCFLFTVRIINYPLLLISLFAFVRIIRQFKKKQLVFLCSICLITILSFIARNIVLSGYLFYPVYQADFFSFDWKADPVVTRHLADFIKYYNRVNTGILPVETTKKYTGLNWIPVWFGYLQYYDKIILLLATAGFLIRLLYLKAWHACNRTVIIFFTAILLQLISWFWVAPDPRFVYGPLLAGVYLLPLGLSGIIISQPVIKKISQLAFIAGTFAMLGYTAVKLRNDSRYRHLILPAMLPVPPVHITHLNGIELRIPEKILGNWNARCYGTALPCLYYIQPGLQARGSEIADGFKIENKLP